MFPPLFLTSVSTKICIRTICTWIIYHWNGRIERFILRKKKLIMCQRSDSNTIRQVFLKYTNIKISNGICICIHEVSIRAGERWKFIGSYMSNCMFDSDLEKFTRCRCRAQFGNLWMQHLTHLRRAEELSPVSMVEMGARYTYIYLRCACKFVEFHVTYAADTAVAAC